MLSLREHLAMVKRGCYAAFGAYIGWNDGAGAERLAVRGVEAVVPKHARGKEAEQKSQ